MSTSRSRRLDVNAVAAVNDGILGAIQSSSGSDSNMSMPLLQKEVDDVEEDGREKSESVQSSSEYEFRLRLMTDSNSAVDDSPPPISPNSTAFDPSLRRGQVKIIRTGDTMHVLTYEDGGKPMITSYAKPLSWRESTQSPRPRLDLSPLRSKFKFEGESAIRTISRYCFPSCIEAQLDNLTLQEILTQAQALVERWTSTRDSGLTEAQRTFLKSQFIPAKLETVLMKDWEIVSEIFEAHHDWKVDQLMFEEPPTVLEVNYKRSECVKSLPRIRLARKRKELLRKYDAFVDMGERVDLRRLRRKRGHSSTFIITADKIRSLVEKSQYYGFEVDEERANTNVSKGALPSQLKTKTSAELKVAKQKAMKANRLLKSAKAEKHSTDKLNPRRDKPMAKIRSQVRKVDRLARLNGESFHNAALTLSKSRGLSGNFPNRKCGSVQDADSLRTSRTQENEVASAETDLDLGLEGVCFDADVAELTNSVMVGTVLEDLEGLVQNPPDNLNFCNSNEAGNSMVEALHAGIDYVPEFPEQFTEKTFPDIVSMEDGLLEAIDTTLGADLDVTNLMEPNPSTSKGDIFLMTGLSASEHNAFDSLGQQLLDDSARDESDKNKAVAKANPTPPATQAPSTTTTLPSRDTTGGNHNEETTKDADNDKENVGSSVSVTADGKETYKPSGAGESSSEDKSEVGEQPEQTQAPTDSSSASNNNKAEAPRKSTRTTRKSEPPRAMQSPTSDEDPKTVSAKKAQALLECTLTGSYWQIPENKFPCNRPKRANAGALMATKSSSRTRERETSSEPKPSAVVAPKRAPRVARVSSKVWCKKFISSAYESPITPDGMVVSKKTALRCIVSIPDSICPTPHEEFLQKYRRFFQDDEIKEIQELIGKARPKIEASTRKSGMEKYLKRLAHKSKRRLEPASVNTTEDKSEVDVQEVKVKVVPPVPIKVKESVTQPPPRQKTYSARSKKFEEDEKTEIVKLEGKRILVDGTILHVDHENYIREKDLELQYDDHEFLSPPQLASASDTDVLPKPTCDAKCKLPHCILGCLCDSLMSGERETKHCGKVRCMLECNCNATNWNTEDADIRSRLRPRVSMLNWSTRLNYLDTYISPDKEKEPVSKSSDHRVTSSQNSNRLKRNIIPPKRNSDFISHPATKKLESCRPMTRQSSKLSPFKSFGNRLQRLKQRQQFLRPLKHTNSNDDRVLRMKKSLRSDDLSNKNNNSQVDQQTSSVMTARQRPALISSAETLNVRRKRKLVAGVDYSLEGTGPRIPPELMARFAPFMEIRFRPKPDKYLSMVSESEESTDDENDEEYANLTYKLNPAPVAKPEESFLAPVIVSYRSCQEGLSDVMYPTSVEIS